MTAINDQTGKLRQELESGFTRLQDSLEDREERSVAAAEFKKFIDLVLEGREPVVTSTSEMITTGEAADILNVSRPTVVDWIDKGKLNSVRHGSHRKLFATEVHQLASQLDKQRDEALTAILNS